MSMSSEVFLFCGRGGMLMCCESQRLRHFYIVSEEKISFTILNVILSYIKNVSIWFELQRREKVEGETCQHQPSAGSWAVCSLCVSSDINGKVPVFLVAESELCFRVFVPFRRKCMTTTLDGCG